MVSCPWPKWNPTGKIVIGSYRANDISNGIYNGASVAYKVARFARNRGASIWGTETLESLAICRMTGVVPEKPCMHRCGGNGR